MRLKNTIDPETVLNQMGVRRKKITDLSDLLSAQERWEREFEKPEETTGVTKLTETKQAIASERV